MSIDVKHPKYEEVYPDWVVVDDCYEGSRRVKKKGTAYLPATEGMREDGMGNGEEGRARYNAYLTRAYFPSYFRDAVDTMTGIVHRKAAVISLPPELEPMRERATNEGDSLDLLLRKITMKQLKDGRVGLLLDVPSGLPPAEAVPFISMYDAKAIINWDIGVPEQGLAKIEFVILDESGYTREADLSWTMTKKYRVCTLSSIIGTVDDTDQISSGSGAYITGVAQDGDDLASILFHEVSLGGVTLDEVPFVFINADDLSADPVTPPLLGLADLVLTIYRGEADYRQTLFAQAQETLVVVGASLDDEDEEVRIGSGTRIDVAIGGDAKFIGISASGLSEMRQSLENDRDLAQQQGSRMLSTKGGDQQSGDALRTRVAAQTASLPGMVKTSAEALTRILRYAAVLKGADPDLVKVEPNLEFTAEFMTGQNLLQLMQSKQFGAPLSNKSLHDVLVQTGMTTMTYEEEIEQIEQEAESIMPLSFKAPEDSPDPALAEEEDTADSPEDENG